MESIENNDSEEMTKLKFNKKDIITEINEKGKYETETTIIKRWEDDINPDTEMYVIKQKKTDLPFIGVVNYLFKREGYCVNTYNNGDQYFGYYSNDLRNKQGLYKYKKKIVNKKILREYYFGLWKDDLKDGRGIYLWLNQDNNKSNNNANNPFNNFNEANFNAYIGGFDKDNFTKGTFLRKEKSNYFVYHGTFDNSKNMKKNGQNCFYYSANLEELLYGTFISNIFTEGYVGKFDDNGSIKDIIKYRNKAFITKQELSKSDNIKNIENKLLTFRNVIMSKDYFGNLYDIFKNVIEFQNKNMDDIEIFNSDKYLDLMDISSSYNKISICKDIEKYVNQ